nr:T9SS type A sorting domain-containing protein [Pseudopedobacter sp.]
MYYILEPIIFYKLKLQVQKYKMVTYICPYFKGMHLSKKIFSLILLLNQMPAHAQFAPQAGQAGTTAIFKDSSVIVAWATHCALFRGWQNIADTTLGKTTVGDEMYATGPAGNAVVSLGDGGRAVVTFKHAVINGSGPDFAIFENGFLTDSAAFLELAFVEVSSDGEHFFKFASVSNVDTLPQLNYYGGIDASKINNLAGKYIGLYGTPFDLEELKMEQGLNVNYITHIRITDVVGSVQNLYGTKDSRNRVINDPWPTPFASAGFDLDAVAVLHEDKTTSLQTINPQNEIAIYPIPVCGNSTFYIQSDQPILQANLIDFTGIQTQLTLANESLNLYRTIIEMHSGIYFLQLQFEAKSVIKKIVVK